jgi:hypothetical protein
MARPAPSVRPQALLADPPRAASRAAEPEAAAPAPVPAPCAPEYRMVAPVELVFSDGGKRVGIRPGTATFLKYQRLAAVLLTDLKKTRGDCEDGV